jgi:K+-sensing histidine kinase KdpD
VVLGTRGFSFLRRLPFVVEWAQKHHITKIVILLCLESRYTKKLEGEMHHKLNELVKDLRLHQTAEGKPKIDIQFISNKGFLQENIKHLAEYEQDLTVIFIGRKVLDYRIDEIKQLPVPFYFLD